MSELLLPPSMVKIAESSKITPQNVLDLRREVFADDTISLAEAEALLALDRTVLQKCSEWSDYFTEALVHYIVFQADPEGIVSENNADWLIRCISSDGLVDSPERMEMLVKTLERAKSSPESLVLFALEQVKQAVLNNQGSIAQSRVEKRFVICRTDVELIRRLLYAFGGDGDMAVTKAEAEFLFELNDATLDADNDPAWSDLFMRAVGNYLMATLGNAMPVRRVTLDESPDLGIDVSVGGMVNLLKSAFSAMAAPQSAVDDSMKSRNDVIEAQSHIAEEVTSEEAQWVIDRIMSDNVIHQNEKALLQFLKDESHSLHPKLEEMLQKAG